MAPEVSEFVAPYIPFRRITNLVEKMETEGVPARVDRSYLRWLSGTDQTYLQNTLKALNLAGPELEVLPALRGLVEDKGGRQDLIADILRDHYPEAVALDRSATHAQ